MFGIRYSTMSIPVLPIKKRAKNGIEIINKEMVPISRKDLFLVSFLLVMVYYFFESFI